MYSFQNAPTSHKILWLTRPDHIAQSILVFVPFWFGIILLNKYNTFETSRAYFYMQMQMTETEWGFFSISCAIIAALCWATNNRYVMIFQNAILMGWHGFVALCIFMAMPFAPATGTYAVLAFAATMRAINLSLSNARNWK